MPPRMPLATCVGNGLWVLLPAGAMTMPRVLSTAGEENAVAVVGPFDHLPRREGLARNAGGQVGSI